MPEKGVPLLSHTNILSYEEITRVVRVVAQLGIRKVRLTGGEPLVRDGLGDLVSMLSDIPGVDDLSMTTNGVLLARHAQDLAQRGLKRVNVSLDSLVPEKYRTITQSGKLENVWEGIAAAEKAGLTPIKINVVVLRDFNDVEVVDMARLTIDNDRHFRFIEAMPMGKHKLWTEQGYVPMAEIKARIETELGKLEGVSKDATVVGNGPARYWRLPDSRGTIGFITPISEHFCAQCNRLRLTSDGKLRPCLLSDYEVDLVPALRHERNDKYLTEVVTAAVMNKPECHQLNDDQGGTVREMVQVGG